MEIDNHPGVYQSGEEDSSPDEGGCFDEWVHGQTQNVEKCCSPDHSPSQTIVRDGISPDMRFDLQLQTYGQSELVYRVHWIWLV